MPSSAIVSLTRSEVFLHGNDPKKSCAGILAEAPPTARDGHGMNGHLFEFGPFGYQVINVAMGQDITKPTQ